MFKIFERIKRYFKVKICSHEFKYKDLKATGIPEPDKPEGNDYLEWKEYYFKVYDFNSDFIKKRIQWTCHKCKETFYGPYGLEILSRTKGKIVGSILDKDD